MKSNAIIRIVIFSFIILILVGILLAGLGIGRFVFDLGSGSGEYITGEGSVSAADVEELEIDWAAGSIRIETAQTDTISFSEEGHAAQNQKMVYELKNGKLTIRFSKSSVSIGFMSTPSKDLTIIVPANWKCDELKINSAASALDITGITADNMQLDMAATDGKLNKCHIKNLDIDAAACDITYDGTLNSMDGDVAACSIKMVLGNVPTELNMDGAAVELDLTLPADCGFRLDMDGLAKDFSSDFATTSRNGSHVYGDERCIITVDGLGSEVHIRKGE